ncbi:hypothetical protein C8J57DRAFT_1717712 [Mycena rebaudengoi]|nr:hypothetical protein C8J57DRAFT_1717712 [Mycena rebaudengoi]
MRISASFASDDGGDARRSTRRRFRGSDRHISACPRGAAQARCGWLRGLALPVFPVSTRSKGISDSSTSNPSTIARPVEAPLRFSPSWGGETIRRAFAGPLVPILIPPSQGGGTRAILHAKLERDNGPFRAFCARAEWQRCFPPQVRWHVVQRERAKFDGLGLGATGQMAPTSSTAKDSTSVFRIKVKIGSLKFGVRDTKHHLLYKAYKKLATGLPRRARGHYTKAGNQQVQFRVASNKRNSILPDNGHPAEVVKEELATRGAVAWRSASTKRSESTTHPTTAAGTRDGRFSPEPESKGPGVKSTLTAINDSSDYERDDRQCVPDEHAHRCGA